VSLLVPAAMDPTAGPSMGVPVGPLGVGSMGHMNYYPPTNSPAPPNYPYPQYPYTPSPPPQMPSPRMNGRGGYPPRGGAYQHPSYRQPYPGQPYPNHLQPKYPPYQHHHHQQYTYTPPSPHHAPWHHLPPQPLSPVPKNAATAPVAPTTPACYIPDQNSSISHAQTTMAHLDVPEQPPASTAPISSPSTIAPVLPPAPEPSSLDPAPSPSDNTAPASDSPSDPSERDLTPSSNSTSARPSRAGGWAIWSRRPLNPAHAPGIIISPRARPPPDIVESALDERTPPASPVILPVAEKEVLPVLESLEIEETPSSTGTETDVTDAEEERSRTPTTAATTMSSSPASMKPVSPPEEEVSAVPSAPSSGVKKSWASLFVANSAASQSSSSSTPARSKLPTSSVVGFSVPATPSAKEEKRKADNAALMALLSGTEAAAAPVSYATASTATAKEKLIPRGLVNTGNMCFANAVLQVLLRCEPFVRFFSRLQALAGEDEDGWLEPAPLVRATGAFMKKFIRPVVAPSAGKGKARAEDEDDFEDAFIPTEIYDALKDKKRFDGMRGGHQEDAEEFLGFFLDTLEEELLAVAGSSMKRADVVEEHVEEDAVGDGWMEVGKKNRTVVTRTIKSEDSPISRIFGGKFRSTLRAPSQRDSVIVEDWRSLRIDIQREGIQTIEDALAFLSHPQSIQMAHPTRPGTVLEASQQVLIDSLPPILVLHMKRFCYDAAEGAVIKVGKQIVFSPELELGNDLMAAKSKPARYRLFGAIYHHGLSAGGGHYTLDVLHGEGWVRIDDELVSDVRPADVFGAANFKEETRCAYLLFYRRIR
ncbi:unnamed protein product, partial [Mycena citricolor]